LSFNLGLRQYGDVAYYHVGPLEVYQLNHPDLNEPVRALDDSTAYDNRSIK
jgi:hypothetical protein